MNYKFVAFFFFWILSSSIYAQSNFKKGYIVNLQGDTVKGYINYKERIRTPSRLEFKSSLKEKDSYYCTVHNTQKIVIEGYELYERFEVLVSMNEIDDNKIDSGANTFNKNDTVFLKQSAGVIESTYTLTGTN